MTVEQTAHPHNIKILRVIARLNVGGPAIQALALTRALNGGGFTSLLVHGAVSPGEADMTQYSGMDVPQRLMLPSLGRELHPIKDLSTLLQLIRIIRRERPHIVHTHTAKAGAVGRAAAALCRVPIIIHTYHGHVFHGYFSPRKTALFKWIEKRLAAVSTRLITISPLQKKEIGGILDAPESKLAVIPLGFQLDRFADCRAREAGAFRAAVGAPADAPLVVIVGRITAIKNHALFLETAARVLARRPDALFAVVGDGEDRPECEAGARALGIDGSVRFAGWWERVDQVYADADVTLLTSNNEGTPVCLIESLAAGVPAVATNVGGVADVVRHGESGFLAPAGDADTLAGFVVQLLDDTDLRARMGRAGREDARARYGEQRLLSDIVALYRELLVEKGVRG